MNGSGASVGFGSRRHRTADDDVLVLASIAVGRFLLSGLVSLFSILLAMEVERGDFKFIFLFFDFLIWQEIKMRNLSIWSWKRFQSQQFDP